MFPDFFGQELRRDLFFCEQFRVDTHDERLLIIAAVENSYPVVFAIGLLASGQQATFTGTLAGQIVMEGFLQFRISPWLRRLITRLLAIVPAIFVIGLYGERKATDLLVFSQVVLSVQLGFAIWPLLRFTGEKAKMGEFVNSRLTQTVGWILAAVISTM